MLNHEQINADQFHVKISQIKLLPFYMNKGISIAHFLLIYLKLEIRMTGQTSSLPGLNWFRLFGV